MEIEEFKELIKTNTDDLHVCQSVLMSSEVWLLTHKGHANSAKVYDEIKVFFSGKLKIPATDVAIVGSAKLGFSLSPFKDYKVFDEEDSDVDVILVSPRKFNEFWDELLALYYGRGSFVGEDHFLDVFRKFVTLERNVDFPSARLRDWHQTMDGLKRDFFARFSIGNKIKYRVYESWDAANSYHASGIAKLRRKLKSSSNA
jgi:hypothetical protein